MKRATFDLGLKAVFINVRFARVGGAGFENLLTRA